MSKSHRDYAPDKRHVLDVIGAALFIYSLINNPVALHEKHPIILPTLFPPNLFSFSRLSFHVPFVYLIPSFFVSKTTTTPPFSFSQVRFVYQLSLSLSLPPLSRSILLPPGVNVKSNVQGMLSVSGTHSQLFPIMQAVLDHIHVI